MLNEVLAILDPQPGCNYLDCTMGGLGYSQAIAQKVLPQGIVVSLDLDGLAIANARQIIADKDIKNIILAHDNFKNLSKIVKNNQRTADFQFSGIVYDLGLSSAQLQDRDRGFSFQFDPAPLDMSFGSTPETVGTSEIVNTWEESRLEMVFRLYGEEPRARAIARAIGKKRKIATITKVGQLVEIIKEIIPPRPGKDKINPATKIFQALRIATNSELENLTESLPQAIKLLRPGGKIVVISYHSLEDKIVKSFFHQEARGCLCPPEFPICNCGHQASLLITAKRVARPTEEEISLNPRSRSAKLRFAIKK